jgi:hypothetical protein
MTLDSPARALIDAAALAATRRRCRPATPAALARRVMPRYRVTPAAALIGNALADAITQPDARLIITVPPRESKSTTVAVMGTLWALSRNPEARIILASYADELAREHSHAARALVAEYPDVLGFRLSADKTATGRWLVDGHGGGLLATGIMSGVTGFGADLLILDDVTKNAAEADSAAHRRRVLHEFRSTLLTRVHPGGSVVIIGTRWSEDDLIGTLLATEGDRWQYVNIPAVAEAGIPDTLGRAPGQAMTSALGRTPEQFADIRQAVASRSWYALYQGVPTAPEGNLIRSEWLDGHRLPSAPPRPVKTVVGVDPSDSGHGDSCGIVAASLGSDGVVAVLADVSAPLTSDAWANRAVELAITLGASEIAVEGFAARETYTRVVTEALHRQRPPHPIRVTSWPPKGSGRGGGDSLARSAGLLAALENGGCRLAGHHPALEASMVSWQAGSHQPDALAALVVAFDVLSHAVGQQWTIAAPVGSSAPGGSRSGGNVAEHLGSRRPVTDALVAEAAARKRAEADGTDPGETPEAQRVARVVGMSDYVRRRMDGGGYDPLAHFGPSIRSR